MVEERKKITALLPMKAHSERVVSKNFRAIAGKPLFRWILDTLCSTAIIDAVIINTDARAVLAEHGLNHGDYNGKVSIRDRRPEICGDHVSMNLILADDIEAIESDYYFMTHTTNPLLKRRTIEDMFDKFFEQQKQNKADSLFSVNRLQTRFYSENGAPINHDPDNLVRTQDLPPYFEENSVGYFFTRQSFKKTAARIGSAPIMFETPRLQSVDIDDPTDWYLAESLLMRLASGEELPN